MGTRRSISPARARTRSRRLPTARSSPTTPTSPSSAASLATNPTGDKSLPSTSWHDEFEDVNNDGLIDLFVAKGNVDEMPGFAMKDPNVLFLGQPDGTFVDEATAAGILSDAARPWGGARRPEPRRPAGPGGRRTGGPTRRSGATSGRGQRSTRRRWATGSRSGWTSRARTMTRSARWVEVRVGDRTMTREVTVGGGHAGGQLGWIHFGLGSAPGPRRPEVRVQWPDMEWGPWLPRRPRTRSSPSNAGPRGPAVDAAHRPDRRPMPMTRGDPRALPGPLSAQVPLSGAGRGPCRSPRRAACPG